MTTHDDPFAPRPVAAWYMPAAIASLLFMLLGCATYVLHVTADPNSLSFDQRAAMEAEPVWLVGAYAVAVWAGLGGTALLVMRKALAQPILLLSLGATLVWFAGLLVVADVRDAMSANDLIVALAVTAVTWTIFWFARHSNQRGWLK